MAEKCLQSPLVQTDHAFLLHYYLIFRSMGVFFHYMEDFIRLSIRKQVQNIKLKCSVASFSLRKARHRERQWNEL